MGRTSFSHTNFNSPCLNCKDRHRACHDTCEKYIKVKKEWKERGLEYNKWADLESYIAKGSVKAYDMMRRKRR